MHFRKVSQRFGIALGAMGQMVKKLMSFKSDVFLEQGMHDHGRGAGVFHSFDIIQAFTERRR